MANINFRRNKPNYLQKTPNYFKDAIGDLPLIKSGESSNKYASEPRSSYQELMRKCSTSEL